jgi:hypothetical protein
MPCLQRLDIRLLLNLGELEELFLVFHVFQEEEHTELDKELSETCAVADTCTPQPRLGADGTERSM